MSPVSSGHRGVAQCPDGLGTVLHRAGHEKFGSTIAAANKKQGISNKYSKEDVWHMDTYKSI